MVSFLTASKLTRFLRDWLAGTELARPLTRRMKPVATERAGEEGQVSLCAGVEDWGREAGDVPSSASLERGSVKAGG